MATASTFQEVFYVDQWLGCAKIKLLDILGFYQL
jgi:hypothetical protein